MHRTGIASLLVAVGLMVACTPGTEATPIVSPSPSGETVSLSGVALAGPVCPVERDPPDPACAPRPVEGAAIVVLDERGDEVATLRTDADGRFRVELSPGRYELVPQQPEGIMHAPAPVTVELRAGSDPEPIELAYDTGIR